MTPPLVPTSVVDEADGRVALPGPDHGVGDDITNVALCTILVDQKDFGVADHLVVLCHVLPVLVHRLVHKGILKKSFSW